MTTHHITSHNTSIERPAGVEGSEGQVEPLTRRMSCTGLKKCSPTKLAGLPDMSDICVICSDEVLEAKMASGLISLQAEEQQINSQTAHPMNEYTHSQ